MSEDDTYKRLKKEPTEDEREFGYKKIVYCDQHLRPHFTGWCSVPNGCKFLLESTDLESARQECKAKGLTLFQT